VRFPNSLTRYLIAGPRAAPQFSPKGDSRKPKRENNFLTLVDYLVLIRGYPEEEDKKRVNGDSAWKPFWETWPPLPVHLSLNHPQAVPRFLGPCARPSVLGLTYLAEKRP